MAAVRNEIADDVETPETEPTLRDQIEEARDAYVAEHETEGSEAASGSQERSGRDDRGRFLPRGDQGQDAGERQTAPATGGNGQAQPNTQAGGAAQGQPATSAQGQGATSPDGSQNGPIVAPATWSPAAKAEWANLSPSIKAEINRREQEVARTFSRHDEERQLGNQLGTIYQQNLDFFQRAQVHPLKLMNDYIGISKILGGSDINAKAELLFHAARTNGIDLRRLAMMDGKGPLTGAPGQPQANGQIQQQMPIPPVVQQALTRIETFEQNQARQAQEQEQRLQQETYDEITQFRSLPESRFFDAVQPYMVALLQGGQASNLKDAYEQAVWARPDIRAILQQEADAARSVNQNRQRKVQTARDRGSSIRGGSGAKPDSSPADRSLREEIQHNMAEALRARV